VTSTPVVSALILKDGIKVFQFLNVIILLKMFGLMKEPKNSEKELFLAEIVSNLVLSIKFKIMKKVVSYSPLFSFIYSSSILAFFDALCFLFVKHKFCIYDISSGVILFRKPYIILVL